MVEGACLIDGSRREGFCVPELCFYNRKHHVGEDGEASGCCSGGGGNVRNKRSFIQSLMQIFKRMFGLMLGRRLKVRQYQNQHGKKSCWHCLGNV